LHRLGVRPWDFATESDQKMEQNARNKRKKKKAYLKNSSKLNWP
jgi:hypothetical protein